jgi:hypothetical protein
MGKVDEIRARWAAATPGPWTHCVWYGTDDGGWAAIGPHHEEDDGISDEPGCDAEQCAERDAEAIAAAPSDVAFLLAELDALRERVSALDKVRAAAERVVEALHGKWNLPLDARQATREIELALDAARGEVGDV